MLQIAVVCFISSINLLSLSQGSSLKSSAELAEISPVHVSQQIPRYNNIIILQSGRKRNNYSCFSFLLGAG